MKTLPLEKRYIQVDNKNGLHKDIPAVDKHWTVVKTWTSYSLPPDKPEAELSGALETWLIQTRRTDQDLVWLLRLPCHIFWSQICFDQTLHRWLGDIMETFPRDHDEDFSWSETIMKTNNSILHKLFLVHVRLCTHKESAEDFFTAEFWGQMLYEKFILELPRILDICVLFSSRNRNITCKMVSNVFKHQPQYNNDLLECVMTICSALETTTEQFQVLTLSQPDEAHLETLEDVISYCVDISVTMMSLVQVFPSSAQVIHNVGLDVRLAAFYASVVIPIVNLIKKYVSADVMMDSESHVARVNISRHNIITCIRGVVCQLCFTDNVPVPERLETFFNLMSSLMSEVSFLTDYNELYSIRAEFDLFESENIQVDSVRKHYILDIFNSTQSSSFMNNQENAGTSSISTNNTVHDGDLESMGASSFVKKPKSHELDSLISSVRDLLPHLGEGFVEHVLVEYSYKVDEAINALLENNLPPHLLSLDQSLPKLKLKEKEPEPVPRSVYDEDEFDVFSQDYIDTSKIHKGKKNKSSDAKKILEDKSDVLKMKDRFDRLGIIEEIETIVKSSDAEFGNDYDYDDEYDDTYDDVPLGEQEPDAKDDLGRGFVLPVALGGGKINNKIINAKDDEEESEDEEQAAKSKMNFVRNPEEVRQEAERRRAEKMSRRGGKGGGGAGHNRDVVGRAKGQGQDKQVLINRARKNTNKGKAQRVGADKKASKGMF